MTNVVNLQEYRDGIKTVISGLARCIKCKHEWGEKADLGEVWLDCPHCTAHTGVFVYPVYHINNLYWECACGNSLFIVGPDGAYCPNCGSWHEELDVV